MKKEQHEKSTLLIDGERISYRIIYTGRKTTSITVHPNQSVIVRAPLQTDRCDLNNWIQGRIPWISRHLKQFKEKEYFRPANNFVSGDFQYFLGERYTLKISSSKSSHMTVMGNELWIYSETSDPAAVEKIFKEGMKRLAQKILNDRMQICFEEARKLRINLPRLRLRWMKSRWGSCSIRAGITLNIRLIHLPVKLIDHVIFHELCHLRVQNHGREFYKLLSELDPEWREHRFMIGNIAPLILPHS